MYLIFKFHVMRQTRKTTNQVLRQHSHKLSHHITSTHRMNLPPYPHPPPHTHQVKLTLLGSGTSDRRFHHNKLLTPDSLCMGTYGKVKKNLGEGAENPEYLF